MADRRGIRRLLKLGALIGGLVWIAIGPLSITAPAATPIVDGFESGDLSKLLWFSGGHRPWTVASGQSHGGEFAVRSGLTAHGTESWLELHVITKRGLLRFWYRVSSEPFDALRFYIDDQMAGKWSGDTGWQPAEFLIDEGPHRFRWVYRKDDSGSEGEDRAWIDDLAFPIEPGGVPCSAVVAPTQTLQSAIADAKPSDVLCLGEGEWTTSLVIDKPVTLRGASQRKTVIRSDGGGRPIVWARAAEAPEQTASVTVEIEQLTLQGAGRPTCADWYTNECGDGVRVTDQARVRLRDVDVAESGFHGLRVLDHGWVELADSRINGSAVNGVDAAAHASMTVLDSEIAENRGDGIRATDAAKLEVAESAIRANGSAGFDLGRWTGGRILASTISDNAESGVLLANSAEIELERNVIERNGVYGVALEIWGCFGSLTDQDEFHGQVSGRANVVPTRTEPDGNQRAAVCPIDLKFLTSERGDAYPP